MKYKITYKNQWGYKHTKTIKADSQEAANLQAESYVKTTEYEYAVGVLGHSELISAVEQSEGAE